MSDIKMSDDDLSSWLRNGTNGHIKNNHIVADRMDTLVAQNLALKSALNEVHSYIFDIQDGHSISNSDGEIIDIVNKALKGVGDE